MRLHTLGYVQIKTHYVPFNVHQFVSLFASLSACLFSSTIEPISTKFGGEVDNNPGIRCSIVVLPHLLINATGFITPSDSMIVLDSCFRLLFSVPTNLLLIGAHVVYCLISPEFRRYVAVQPQHLHQEKRMMLAATYFYLWFPRLRYILKKLGQVNIFRGSAKVVPTKKDYKDLWHQAYREACRELGIKVNFLIRLETARLIILKN